MELILLSLICSQLIKNHYWYLLSIEYRVFSQTYPSSFFRPLEEKKLCSKHIFFLFSLLISFTGLQPCNSTTLKDFNQINWLQSSFFLLSQVLILSVSVTKLISYEDIKKPTLVAKQWQSLTHTMHGVFAKGVHTVSACEIHSQNIIGWPKYCQLVVNNFLRCHASRVNTKLHDYKTIFSMLCHSTLVSK